MTLIFFLPLLITEISPFNMFVGNLLTENFRYTTAVLVATTIIIYLITSVVLQRIRFYKKPCNLPVLNLKDGNYEKAKMEFMVNLPKYLEEGREKASYLLGCGEGHGCPWDLLSSQGPYN
jgi:hypothetical protein